MKKYRVDLEGHVSVEVEATSETDAEKIVIGSLEYYTRNARWEIEPYDDSIVEVEDEEGGNDEC